MKAAFIGLPFFSFAQLPENLVLNPSFEENFNCSPGPNAIEDLVNWYNLFQSGSPGYFSGCSNDFNVSTPSNVFGFQNSRTAISYSFQVNFALNEDKHYANPPNVIPRIKKEPFSGVLVKPLVKDNIYYLEFYVSRCQSISNFIATDAFDIIFSRDSVSYSYPYDPFVTDSDIYWSNTSGKIIEDTMNWVKMSGCFTARGGEKFFTVGAFRDTSVINNIFYSNSELTYLAAYYYDDFLIYQCDTCCPEEYPIDDYIQLNGNPVVAGESPVFEVFLNPGHTADIKVFDAAGRIVYESKIQSSGQHQMPYGLATGVYVYALINNEDDIYSGKVVVN